MGDILSPHLNYRIYDLLRIPHDAFGQTPKSLYNRIKDNYIGDSINPD